VKEQAVVDSTCLIGLERINQLSILPALFDPIFAPPEVQREFGVSLPWLQQRTPLQEPLVAALKMLVDDGEAEAISLAQEIGCLLIVDDRRARTAASGLGLTCVGTLGVLLRGKRTGAVSAVKPIMDNLEANGFFISDALRREALRLANE
jgi:uncharacterized protein